MKLIAIILVLLLCSINLLAQTREAEVANVAKRYQTGEINATEYNKMGAVWNELMDAYGGYPEFPLNANGKIEYEYVKAYEKIDKQIIFNRIHEWAAIVFGNLNNVLHYENYETGKIIFKGYFNLVHKADHKVWSFGKLHETIQSRDCYQTYVFTIKGNKIKLQIINVTYEYSKYEMIGTTYLNVDYKIPIGALYPITNGDYAQWKERLDILVETKKKVSSTVESLDLYIRNETDDYIF